MDVEVAPDRQSLTLRPESGQEKSFLALWLRDNCSGPDFCHPVSGQKYHDLSDLPPDVVLLSATVASDQLQVTFGPENLTGSFPLSELLIAPPPPRPAPAKHWRAADWNGVEPAHKFPEIATDAGARRALAAAVCRDGLALVADLPPRDAAVADLAMCFGPVRETNYGRIFDVRAELNPANLAYTGLALPLHTDNPYRQPVPGLQFLNCLSCDENGGDSLVADGYAVAADLLQEDASAYRCLKEIPIRFGYRDATVDLQASAPVIEQDCNGAATIIRYNNRAIRPFDHDIGTQKRYYPALRKFSDMLQNPAYALEFRLQPGWCLVMDNHRVLHGRSAYTGAGRRHLQGCYAEKDGLYSSWHIGG